MTAHLHGKSHAAHPTEQSMRCSALFMVMLLLFAQVSFIVHLAVYPHVFSPDTGKAAHPTDRPDHSDRFPGKPGHPNRDNECRVFAVLTQASIVPIPQVLSVNATCTCDKADLLEFKTLHICQSPLFRLSPSHSPPTLA